MTENQNPRKAPPCASGFVVDFVDNAGFIGGGGGGADGDGGRGGSGKRADRIRSLLRRSWSRRRREWRRLVLHARRLEHVGPLAAGTRMTVLEVLPKVISPEEFLGLITFTKLVHVTEMLTPSFPVGRIGKLFSAVSAAVR